jgi:ferritin-like protein
VIALLYPKWKVYLDKDHNQLRADLGRKFPELAEGISENAATAIERHLQCIVDHVTQEVINHPRRIFEQRKAEAQAAFNLAESERQQLAEEARQLRETKFVPLRHRISEFKAALDAQFTTNRS